MPQNSSNNIQGFKGLGKEQPKPETSPAPQIEESYDIEGFKGIDKTQDNNPLDYVKKDIQKKAGQVPTVNEIQNDRFSEKQELDRLFKPKENKAQLSNAEANFSDVYANVGDEFIPRYDNYLVGSNNNERLARQQSSWDKWSNGLTKAGINTLSTAAGGTIGSVTGLTNFVTNGFNTEDLYTDDFNVWLDELNQKMDYRLPNYYTEQEQNENFFESMGTANFWANDFAQGLSFTLGAIVSEGIWTAVTGGAGIATKLARWSAKGAKNSSRALRGLSEWSNTGKKLLRSSYSNVANDFSKVKSASKLSHSAGDLFNTARFTYTSAGYEAGVEARQFKKAAKENFNNYYQENYGRQPNQEEKRKFNEKLTSSANSLYGANIALIGGSNLAVFGRMFNVKNPLLRSGRKSLSKGVNKTLFGVGTETSVKGGQVVAKKVTPNLAQKIAGRSYKIARPAVVEGFWEEGNQSVFSNTAESWVGSGYNKEGTKNSGDLMGTVYDSFAETYGSKEGWKEIGIGALVGLVGGGISGNIGGYSKSLKAESDYADAVNGEIGAQTTANRMFTQNQIFKARQDEMNAEQRGDYVGQQEARKRGILSNVALFKRFGREAEAFEDFKTAINTIDSKKVAEENNVTEQEVEDYKEQVIKEYEQLSDSYSENKDFADNILGNGQANQDLFDLDNEAGIKLGDKDQVSQALAYSMTMGDKADETSKELLDMIKVELAGITGNTMANELGKSQRVWDALSKTTKAKRKQYQDISRKREKLKQQKNSLEDKIFNLQEQIQRLDPSNVKSKQEDQARLTSLNRQLNETNNQLEETKTEFELAYKSINTKNPFGEDVSAEELDNVLKTKNGEVIGGRLSEINDIIEATKETDPQRYSRFKKLYNEYRKSVYSYKEYNKAIAGITNDNFDPGNYITKFSQLVHKNKKANEFTKKFLAETLLGTLSRPGTEAETETNTNVQVGDEVQWEKEDKEQFEKPRKVTKISEDGKDVFVEGSETGIPINEVQKQEQPAQEQTEEGDAIEENPQSEEAKKTPVERLKKKIDDLLKENSGVGEYIGTNLSEADASRPTSKEIENYQKLAKKLEESPLSETKVMTTNPSELKEQYGSQIALTEEEIGDLQNLNQKFGKWQIQEGTFSQETSTSLADLLKRLDQLQQELPEQTTKKEITKEDSIDIVEASERNSGGSRNSKNFVQTQDGVYIKHTKKGTVELSHLTIEGFIDNVKDKTGVVRYKKTQGKSRVKEASPEKIRSLQGQEGYEFYIEREGKDPLRIETIESSRLSVDNKSWEGLKNNNSFAIKFITSEVDPHKNSFILGYDENTGQPTQTDFEIETTEENRPVQMVDSEMRGVKQLHLHIDPKAQFNANLIDGYKKAKKSKNKEAIKNAQANLESQVLVYLLDSNNKIAGTLRGGLDVGDSESMESYKAIRQNAAETLKNNPETSEDLISMGTTLDVKGVFKGSPIFNVEFGDNGSVNLVNKPITSKDLKLIKAAGYAENGEIAVGGKIESDKVDKTYLPKSNRRTPIVVFDYKGSNVAFPVTLTGKTSLASQKLEDILSFTGITDGQKVNKINSLLIEYGIDPNSYDITENDLVDTRKIENLHQYLEQYQEFAKVEDWAKEGYNLSNLKFDAEINIDITNNPFNTPKLNLDFKNSTIAEKSRQESKISKTKQRVERFKELSNTLKDKSDKLNSYVVDFSRENEKELESFEKTDFAKNFDINGSNKFAIIKTLKDSLFKKGGRKITIPKQLKPFLPDGFMEGVYKDLKEFTELQKTNIQDNKDIKMSKELSDDVKKEQDKPCK